MIKRMEGKKVSIEIDGNGRITLEIDGVVSILYVDDFEELRNMAGYFWDANNLYSQTSEFKADRERHESEWGRPLTATGLQQASKY